MESQLISSSSRKGKTVKPSGDQRGEERKQGTEAWSAVGTCWIYKASSRWVFITDRTGPPNGSFHVSYCQPLPTVQAPRPQDSAPAWLCSAPGFSEAASFVRPSFNTSH